MSQRQHNKQQSQHRHPATSVTAAQDALPPGARPLAWDEWRAWSDAQADSVRLVISGVPGKRWLFAGGIEYGREKAVALVPCAGRGQLWQQQADRVIAPLARVYVVDSEPSEVR